MPSFATFTVASELEARPGLQRVELSDGSRAYALTDLTGPVSVGDDVVVNTTAVDLGLGTGGWHVIHWNLTRRTWESERGGHVMKLRYTSLQTPTGVAAEFGDVDPTALRGVPVVAVTLHSQLAGVLAGVRLQDPSLHTVFVMTGGGALPIALSDLVHALRGADLLAATITAGHTFGGDLEAVGVADALCLAAARFGPAVVVVGPGPGIVGTAGVLGTSALDAVAALDLATALGGHPVLCVRASANDERPRHQGISHHTRTVARLLRSGVDIAVPPTLEAGAMAMLRARDATLERHRLVVQPTPDAADELRALDVEVTTMGRDASADAPFLAAAVACGIHAASLARDAQ